MKLVEKHIINSNNKFYQELDNVAFKSKNLYNATLYAVRQHFFNNGSFLNYNEVQRQFQNNAQFDYYQLPTKVSQWVMKMVNQNFKSFFIANQKYKETSKKFKGKPKLPKYLNKKYGRYLITYTNQAISKNELKENKRIKLSGTDVYISTNLTYEQIKQVRIVAKPDYYIVEVIYDKKIKELKDDNGKYASIDLGVNNLVALTTNIKGEIPVIVNGRKLKSINHYYNKKLSEIKNRIKKINKLEKSKRTRRLTLKRNNKVTDYLHKTSRYVVNQLVSRGINTLIIGKNNSWKQDINIGKVNNQNFVQIPHTILIEMLKYKCKIEGINVIIQEESYTSKCSFLDNEQIQKHEIYLGKRIKRGLFRSKDGNLINADVNGSYNILRKSKPNVFTDGLQGIVVCPIIIAIMN
jgi:IS605 OrfB family transposase